MNRALEIRPLVEGEERAWVEVDTPAGEVDARLRGFLERRARFPEPPLCRVVALRGERIVAKMGGTYPHPGLFVVNFVRAIPGEPLRGAGDALLSHLLGHVGVPAQAIAWERPEQDDYFGLLERCGFALFMRKPFVKRQLAGYRLEQLDPLSYRSLEEVGYETFAEALARISEGSLSEDMIGLDSRADLEESVEEAGTCFDPRAWKLGFKGDDLVGAMLPQRFPDLPRQGTVLKIGIVPHWRGRGFGTVMHAAALGILSGQGVEEYVGSTGASNLPMLRIFERNACPVVGVRRIYRHETP